MPSASQGCDEIRVVLSAERPSSCANWLRLDPSQTAAMFIVRQTFGVRNAEEPAQLTITCVDGDGRPAHLTPAALDVALGSCGLFVGGAAAMFAAWAREFERHTNELPLFDQRRSDAAGGDPNIRYYHSYWRLRPSQVLVITFTPPPCRCWNFQLNNHWMESLDYRYYDVHTNSDLAWTQPDGSCTIVVSIDDPPDDHTRHSSGRNWLVTAGHTCGTMCFRYVAPRLPPDQPLPHPRVEVRAASENSGIYCS